MLPSAPAPLLAVPHRVAARQSLRLPASVTALVPWQENGSVADAVAPVIRLPLIRRAGGLQGRGKLPE